ncbi:MAG TPA: hypothetical protein VNY31_09640 [Solirubrobacteraceae bacterium]|nr:hypothetical protein [Solirubrobacteraceae bacterium]
MTRLRTLGLAFVAAFAFSAVASASALAVSPNWEKEEGKAFSIFTAATKVKSKTPAGKPLMLTDKKGGVFGESVTLECEGTDEGTIGPEKNDEITAATATSCKTAPGSGSCGSPSTEPVNLPWKTELFLSGAEIQDKLTANIKSPGWKVICNGFVEDTCEATANLKMKNNSPNVEAEFVEKETATCTRGGAKAGTVSGIDITESPGGAIEAIRVN